MLIQTKEGLEKIPLGTKLYFVQHHKIRGWYYVGPNPAPGCENYQMFISDADVSQGMGLHIPTYLKQIPHIYTEYSEAKEAMWEQLVDTVQTANEIYFKNEKYVNFTKDEKSSDISHSDRMDKILVRYFHQKLPYLDLEDKEEYNYSDEVRNQIINKIIDAGYNVMLQSIKPSEGEKLMIIWIDKYRFQQR
jgi:hypothetical protein